MNPVPPPFIGIPPYYASQLATEPAPIKPEPVMPATHAWFCVVLVLAVTVRFWK